MGQEILNCTKCKKLGHSNPSGPFVRNGTRSILVIGEFPKKKESGEVTNFTSPTFKRLREELAAANIDFDDCGFTEMVKCKIERKEFFPCAENCVYHLVDQISEIKPDLMITLGVSAKKVLEDYYKQEIEMGAVSEIGGFKLLCLYHPSPANPTGHKRNLEILTRISKEL